MAAIHDRAREHRWAALGHRRLTARISLRADAVLDRLAQAYACARRDVVEGLLLGTIDYRAARDRAGQVPLEVGVGFRRLTMRITRKASEALRTLAAADECEQRVVVERLLTGAIDPRALNLHRLASEERLSPAEVVAFCQYHQQGVAL